MGIRTKRHEICSILCKSMKNIKVFAKIFEKISRKFRENFLENEKSIKFDSDTACMVHYGTLHGVIFLP
jgi:hypothetical protein